MSASGESGTDMSTGLLVAIVIGAVVVFGGGLAAIIVPIVRRANRTDADRVAEWERTCAANGWQWTTSPRYTVTGNYQGLPFYAEPVCVAARHEEGLQPPTVALHLPVALPRLEVNRSTTFESRLNQSAGRGDRQFESGRFNDAFDVQTDNERFASDVLNPRMMEWLLTDPASRDKQFDIRAEWLTLGHASYSGRTGVCAVGEITQGLEFLRGVHGHIPPFVWDAAR